MIALSYNYSHLTLGIYTNMALVGTSETYLHICPSFLLSPDLTEHLLVFSYLPDPIGTGSFHWLVLFPSRGTGFSTYLCQLQFSFFNINYLLNNSFTLSLQLLTTTSKLCTSINQLACDLHYFNSSIGQIVWLLTIKSVVQADLRAVMKIKNHQSFVTSKD